jgi:hypothetical protein
LQEELVFVVISVSAEKVTGDIKPHGLKENVRYNYDASCASSF